MVQHLDPARGASLVRLDNMQQWATYRRPDQSASSVRDTHIAYAHPADRSNHALPDYKHGAMSVGMVFERSASAVSPHSL